MKNIFLTIVMLLCMGATSVFAANMQLEISYQKNGLSTDGTMQNISGFISLLSDETKNYNGVIIVFDSPQITVNNRNADYNHDGFYNGKPFWNLGNVIARGAGIAEVKFQVPVAATNISFTATILNSVSAPIANAGNDKVGETSKTVVLDGSKTFDPDGNALTYKWTLKVKPVSSNLTDADIKDGDKTVPYFVPDVAGKYEIGLDVKDSAGNMSADIVAIDVTDAANADPAPHADAGVDQFAAVSKQLKFDGRSSFDPKGEPLTFSWTFIRKPKDSTITEANFDTTSVSGMCIFTPDVAGKYILHLRVSDPGGKTTTSTVKGIVLAVNDNLPPFAKFGNNQDVFIGKEIPLDGSLSSDPEGSVITYKWMLIEKPMGSAAALISSTNVSSAFSPDVKGIYKVMLTVSDGTFTSLPAIVQFTAFDQTTGVVTSGTGSAVADSFSTIIPVDGTSVLAVTSPVQGAVYPTNVQPKFAWHYSGMPVDGSKVVLSYKVAGIDKTASFITTDQFYVPSAAVWGELSKADNSGETSFVVYLKSGSTVYSSKTITFKVSDVRVSGNIIFWGISNTSNIYSLNTSDTLANPVYGDLTGNGCAGCHSVSSQGDLAVNESGIRIVSLSNTTGVPTDVNPEWSSVLSWSADGSKLLYTSGTDIYVYNKVDGTKNPVAGLSRSDRDEVMATFAPDGSIVAVVAPTGSLNAFSYGVAPGTQIVRLKNDGTEQVLVTAPDGYTVYYPSVSPDGKWVVFNQSNDTTYSSNNSKLWLVPFDGSVPAKELVTANGTYLDANGNVVNYGNSWPTWAPDSSWIAFSSNRPIADQNGNMQSDWSIFTSLIDPKGNDSVSMPLPGASAGNMGEHIPYWTK